MDQKPTVATIDTKVASVYSVCDENRNSLRRQELLNNELTVQELSVKWPVFLAE